jgi:hypothetical protein
VLSLIYYANKILPMFMRFHLAAFFLSTSLIQFTPMPASAKAAKCLLVVDGKTYINGYCDFQFEGGNGSFSFDDKKLRLGCYSFDLGPGQCSGALTKVTQRGTFGGLSIQKPGVGKFWWNAGELRKGSVVMSEPLYRDGACWSNRRVKLCAW